MNTLQRPMRELSVVDFELVHGGTVSGDLVMLVSGTGASFAAGAITGVVFGGLPGAAIGGVGSAIVTLGVGAGYILSGGTFGRIDQSGVDYCGCNYH